MPDYLVSYDLRGTEGGPHKQFLTSAEPRGWLYVIEASSDKKTLMYRLPNTTLWGVFGDRTAARAAFDLAHADAEKALGAAITVEKRIITKLDDWYVRSDKAASLDPKLTAPTKLERCRKHQLHSKFD